MIHITFWGLTVLDIAIIVIYFIAIIIIAIRAARLVNNREDYFMAGRKFGKLIQTFAAFGQATSGYVGWWIGEFACVLDDIYLVPPSTLVNVGRFF
jgi:ABC-type uncharacterized transport system fused permease/ATPase subunit